MMSLETIRSLADEAARKAAKEKKQPYVPYNADEVDGWASPGRPVPIPNLGSHRPKGWKLVDELFVDSSGWGREDEPALTIRGFKAKVKEHITADKEYGYGLIEEGQFQVRVGVFKRVKP